MRLKKNIFFVISWERRENIGNMQKNMQMLIGTELYLILTANMLTTSGITKMQVRAVFADNSIKKSNIFELKVNRSISATDYYEEYAVTVFDQLVAECQEIIDGAEGYVERAETAAVNAEAYEQSASASATSASNSATTASTSAATATTAAETATAASTSASTSAETASTAAASASASATTATAASESAQASASTATTASEAAVNASNTATSAKTSAETAANSASASATSASTSASNASTSATAAHTSETNASNSATAAATSETNAAASATSASNSATSASTSATNAANSASAAATSASNAAVSATNASTSETNASASATEAAEAAETVASSVAQINENTYRINDLEAIIGGYTLTDLPTGEMASVTNGTALLMPSLKIGIEPVQDLNGYDHPWAGGGGKNLFNKDDSNSILEAYFTDSTILRNDNARTIFIKCKTSTTYTVSKTAGTRFVVAYTKELPTVNTAVYGSIIDFTQSVITITTGDDAEYLVAFIYNVISDTITAEAMLASVQIEQGSTATSYEPYSNICPISGNTETNIIVSPTTSASDGTTYTVEFLDGDNPLTVYGGTLNAISGLLTVTDAYIASYSGETLPSTWISDRDVYAAGITPTTGAEVVYTLENSVTYQLTPTQIRTLVGNNNIWADTGDIIEGKYYGSPS